MHMNVGIVGFAFGLRVFEPNPSNIALAKRVAAASSYVNFRDSRPIVVAQGEITKGLNLQYDDWFVDHTVELPVDGTYLDSEGVWKEAKELFELEGVTQVIIIAQPFLHLTSLKKMVRGDNYEVLEYSVGPIPFDNERDDKGEWLNTQPWTRSKFALLIYAIKRLLGMKGGHNGRQNAT